MTDQELLGRFRADRDEAAFRALVRRHGSMVFDVCRNVLGNEADADDAFQATFLVLAQKAAFIRKEASLASWLFGVASRIALTAQRNSTRRQKYQSCRSDQRTAQAPDESTWREVQQVLYEELNKISKCYRTPLVLCYLEGKTQDEAAAQLGVSKATVKKQLERGRALLRVRLMRRGLGPVAVLLAASWPLAIASANPGPILVASTVKAAARIPAGQMVAAGLVSTKVAALMETVVKTMLVTRLKTTGMVVLAVVLAGSGTGMITYRPSAVAPYARASLASAEQAPATDAAGTTKLNDRLIGDGLADWENIIKEVVKIGTQAPDALDQAAPHVEAPAMRPVEEAPAQRCAEEHVEAPAMRPAEEAPEQRPVKQVDRRADLEALIRQLAQRLQINDSTG
jgi:RNA polymerase sigma factor (sigma-70 family)